jgi:hypothetical protein
MAQSTKAESRVVIFPGPAGGVPKLGRGSLDTLLGRRFPALRLICGVNLACGVLTGVASVVAVRFMAVPPSPSRTGALAATLGAVALVVAAGLLSALLLGRAGRGTPPPTTAEGVEGLAIRILDAYTRATGLGSCLLAAAACLGLVIAVLTGSVRSALVVCLAAVAGMIVRWPQRGAVEALLARRGLR